MAPANLSRRSTRELEDLLARDDPVRGGMAAARQFSSVVLPACVPPATRTLRPLATAASRKVAACLGSVPRRTRSSRWSALTTNLRTLTCQCVRLMSGMTTCSREPSGRVASTNGLLRATRRPLLLSIRSTRSRTSSAVRIVGVSSAMPPRATKTLLGSLFLTFRPRPARGVRAGLSGGCDAGPFRAVGRTSLGTSSMEIRSPGCTSVPARQRVLCGRSSGSFVAVVEDLAGFEVDDFWGEVSGVDEVQPQGLAGVSARGLDEGFVVGRTRCRVAGRRARRCGGCSGRGRASRCGLPRSGPSAGSGVVR